MAKEIGDARIRLPDRITKGEVVFVSAIVSHPMDTGFFRTRDGDPIPAYFISKVLIEYGGEEVARYEWTSGISRDPVVTFTLKADREAPLAMEWTDNTGAIYRQSVDVRFTAA